MTPRLSGHFFLCLVWFSLCSGLSRELRDSGVLKNLPLTITINTLFVLQKIDQLSINLCAVIKYFKIKKSNNST